MLGSRTINLNVVCHECAVWVRDGQMGETHYADHLDVLSKNIHFYKIGEQIEDNVNHSGL